jgi:hypothetical protein
MPILITDIYIGMSTHVRAIVYIHKYFQLYAYAHTFIFSIVDSMYSKL